MVGEMCTRYPSSTMIPLCNKNFCLCVGPEPLEVLFGCARSSNYPDKDPGSRFSFLPLLPPPLSLSHKMRVGEGRSPRRKRDNCSRPGDGL